MSLLAPRFQESERASALLPTIKCSSCAGTIPVSSLGDHVCRPPAAAQSSVRNIQRPPQIAIPDNNSRRPIQPPPPTAPASGSVPRYGPSAGGFTSHSTNEFQIPPRPPYATSSSSRSSSGNLSIPSPGGMYSAPQVRTPSPTNPFFPHPNHDVNAKPPPPPPAANVVHGLGLGVGSHMPTTGPYASTRTMESSPPLPDTTSGGGAGMAGVGRRAFAAAAWGVRAGVALAAVTKPQQDQNQSQLQRDGPPSHPQSYSQPHFQPQSQYPPRPTPQHQPHSMPNESTSAARSTPMVSGSREPPLLPKVSLSGRQRSGPSPNAPQLPLLPSAGPSPPRRSASSLSGRSSQDHTRRPSTSSVTDEEPQTSVSFGKEKASNSHSAAGKLPFFEKYKQLVTNSSNGSGSSNSSGPGLGLGRRLSGDDAPQARVGRPDSPLVESPVQGSFDLDEDDMEGSSLPWATPALGGDSISKRIPEPINTASAGSGAQAVRRYPTDGSVSSASSGTGSLSAGSGKRYPGSGSADNEEVVTPSQSWEGLADKASGNDRHSAGIRDSPEGPAVVRQRLLAQIGEEDEVDDRDEMGFDDDDDDEGERLVFGSTPKPVRKASAKRRGSDEGRLPNSHSNSTITSRSRPALTSSGYANEAARSRTVPDVKRISYETSDSHSQSQNRPSSRRSKTCAKCGDSVGGVRRFVERDGVVLCERDWKLLYLPSCRKCNLPIEKSAVSSSDGQLKGKWHKECFGCSKCGKAFEGDSFYVLHGRPWCQHHYHEENGTLCAAPSCRLPIEGPCILSPSTSSSMEAPQRFHPGHLKCDHRGGVSGHQSCKESMDEYYDVAGGRYCERHVNEVLRREREAGRGGERRAEKRMTRLVELPVGGF